MSTNGETPNTVSARTTLPRTAAFWLVALAFGVTMTGTTLPTPLYVLYQQELGFSTLMITVIYAAYAAGVLVMLVLYGRLSDVIGRRRALLPGLLCSALSAVVFLTANGLPLLLTGRVLSGLSAGIFTGTATAALVDLADERASGRASLVGTAVNMGGLGMGPLLAGVLVQVAPDPLRLVFAVDLALVVIAAVGVWLIPETVALTEGGRRPALGEWLRPRVAPLSLPAQVRGTFVRAAIAGFAGFAVLGLFTAVSPSFLGKVLGLHSHALSGGVVFCVFAGSTLGQITLVQRLGRVALPVGCAVLIAGMALLTLGLATASLGLLITAAVVAGLGQGVSFRAGLASVNAQAPAAQRAGVASSFFVVLYVAISLPVVGEGLAANVVGLRTAGISFSVAVAVLAAIALAALLRAGRAGHATQASG
jgi:MFS family permease